MKPDVLLIRPYAGHTARQMERMVSTLEKSFNVYMPEIPHENYYEYLTALRQLILENQNIIGVCQGGVGTAMAMAIQDGNEVKDKKVVLIGAPIDTSIESPVSRYIKALGAPLLLQTYGSTGRVSGDLLTASYMALDPIGHASKLVQYWTSPKYRKFYDMYFDTEDMSRDFFESSIDFSFIVNVNARSHPFPILFKDNKSLRFDYGAINTTNQFMTVEGSRDDITAPGQTSAIFNNLPRHKKRALTVDAGHYGCFSGSVFDREVMPKLEEMFN